MIRLLPFILIPLLILGGLGYWRYASNRDNSTTTEASQEDQAPIEVPKTLPNASVEDRVQSLEDTLGKLVPQVNSLKSGSQTGASTSLDAGVANVEAALVELKARVSALEKATPAPASGSKYPLYIPVGGTGGPWGDQDWLILTEYQVNINPDNYAGYTGMQLEANFRISEAGGTGYVRLYNVTGGSSIVSEVSTTSSNFSTQTSATFKLPGGQKTYTIQVKSTGGKSLFVQSARLKVNF